MQEKGKRSWCWARAVLTQAESEERSGDYSHSSQGRRKLWYCDSSTRDSMSSGCRPQPLQPSISVGQRLDHSVPRYSTMHDSGGFYEVSWMELAFESGRLANADGHSYRENSHPDQLKVWGWWTEKYVLLQSNRESSCLRPSTGTSDISSSWFYCWVPQPSDWNQTRALQIVQPPSSPLESIAHNSLFGTVYI